MTTDQKSRATRPGVGGLPYRIVAEVLQHGVGDEYGPPGYGEPTETTKILVLAGLVEMHADGQYWRARRTLRGREWLTRFAVAG
jgi:hypothetical protein